MARSSISHAPQNSLSRSSGFAGNSGELEFGVLGFLVGLRDVHHQGHADFAF